MASQQSARLCISDTKPTSLQNAENLARKVRPYMLESTNFVGPWPLPGLFLPAFFGSRIFLGLCFGLFGLIAGYSEHWELLKTAFFFPASILLPKSPDQGNLQFPLCFFNVK